MNFFKKNKKPKVVETKTVPHHTFSTKALEVEYNVLMEDYKINPNEDTQRVLLEISRILNQRAYEQGNGKLYEEIKDVFPQITKDKFQRMTDSEKENMKRILKAKKEVDEAARKLSEPDPVEFSMKIETPTTIKQDQTKNEVIHQTNYDKKQDEEVVLINEVEVKQKKMKIPGMNFFKKKKQLSKLPKELDGDFVMKPKKKLVMLKLIQKKKYNKHYYKRKHRLLLS